MTVAEPPPAAHNHWVGFYDDDPSLVSAVSEFLAEALDSDGAIVVIAGATHRVALDDALAARGLPVDALAASGRYRAFDAQTLLAKFMRAGRPDREGFIAAVGPILAKAGRAGRPVSVFGEMVAELWDAGNDAAAIELESLWNDLATRYEYALFCGYSMSSVAARDDLAATRGVCDRHAKVLLLRESGAASAPPAVGETDRVTRLFVPARGSLSAVRAFVGDVLRLWGEARWSADASIVASELATNALVHATSPFRVSLSRTPSMIRIAVQDTVRATPEHLAPDPTRVGGWGIALIDAITDAWGADVDSHGKTVWAELRAS